MTIIDNIMYFYECSREEANGMYNLHRSECDGNPSVYVGTYAKYNEGSLFGMWVDLTTFHDYDDYTEFCEAIHADEKDPEIMLQDYECFSRDLYNESGIDEDDFNKIVGLAEAVEAYGEDMVNEILSNRPDIASKEDIDELIIWHGMAAWRTMPKST